VTLPSDPLRWSPEALDELRDRAAIIWEGAFRCDEASWPEAYRMAVRCVRVRVDRAERVVYPAHR